MREQVIVLGERPQINLSCSTGGRMWLVGICAGLVITQAALIDSFASLGLALAAVATAVLTEAFICYRTWRPLSLGDGSAVASALVMALLLPGRIPPVYAAMGALFAMAVVKHGFGGLGANWLNPAAGGWLFIRCSWPGAFRRALEAAPPPELSSADTLVRSFLNGTIFSLTGSELPQGYIGLLASSAGGIIADQGIGALLLGTLMLIVFRAGRSWIPVLYLGIYGVLIRAFGALPFGGLLWEGDILHGFLSGGTLAAAFLLAGDPATGAKSGWGVLLMTVVLAIFTFIFRYPGGELYGAFLAVLLVNTLVPLVRGIESRYFYGKRRSA